MEPLLMLFVFGATAWIASLVAGGLALRWALVAFERRFRAVLALGVLTLGLGYFGMNNLHLNYSRSVNGRGWSIDSKWFFLATLVLAVAALGVALWKWIRLKRGRTAATG